MQNRLAGNLGQPGHGVQRRRIGGGAGVRAGGPVRVDAPGRGHRRGQRGGPGGQLGDPVIEKGDLVQQQGGELAVVVIEHAVQRLGQVVVPGFHPGPGIADCRGGPANGTPAKQSAGRR